MCSLTHFLSLQDEVLTVIRRVDENWAEGMLGDKIGIFPILYVEVNPQTLHRYTQNTHIITEIAVKATAMLQQNTCITVLLFIMPLLLREVDIFFLLVKVYPVCFDRR